MNILYVASQAKPYIDISDLGDIAAALPKALCTAGYDCRVILPLYAKTRSEHLDDLKKIASYKAMISGEDQDATLYETKHGDVKYYFIENDKYFEHFGFYGTYADGERYAFFCKAVINALPFFDDWMPNVIHCNNWECGAIPIYLRAFCRLDRYYSKIKTVFTIHNIEHQGDFSMDFARDVLGIPEDKLPLVEHNGRCNFMKAAIDQCDVVTTVSRTYAAELLDSYHGLGMEKVLKERKYKLAGIMNGIDSDEYDPLFDPCIPFHYSCDDISGKALDKEALQRELGLNEAPGTMLIGIVASMIARKGLDLVEAVERKLMNMNVQLVVLGVGQSKFVDYFRRMQKMYPGRVAMINEYNTTKAKRIFAASDIILLPCKTEPCGLTQMKAMRYGALPLVREVGGLRDSVHDVDHAGGNGFTFQNYNAEEMLETIRRANEHYHSRSWKELVTRAMRYDFSWHQSAAAYAELYRAIAR